jgi:hypothetical protein
MKRAPESTIIDMTPDGRFVPPKHAGFSLSLTGWLALAAVSSVMLLTLVITVWFAITLLPVVIALALIGFLATRLRRWRLRRAAIFPAPSRWSRP